MVLALPEWSYLSSRTLYLEAWQGPKPTSNFLDISVPSLLRVLQHLETLKVWEPESSAKLQNLLQGTSLDKREQRLIRLQEGWPEWEAAAAHLPAPCSRLWDVVISHADSSADIAFARALKQILERTGWGLRVFLNDDSVLPGVHPDSYMQQALESTQLVILLFSKEYFSRLASMSELKLLWERHVLHEVQLLPVFLSMTVEECKRELSSILQPGAPGCMNP